MLDNTQEYRHTLRICNTAFSGQQWLRERASMLRYTDIVLLQRRRSVFTARYELS
jgi:hypothetical protein